MSCLRAVLASRCISASSDRIFSALSGSWRRRRPARSAWYPQTVSVGPTPSWISRRSRRRSSAAAVVTCSNARCRALVSSSLCAVTATCRASTSSSLRSAGPKGSRDGPASRIRRFRGSACRHSSADGDKHFLTRPARNAGRPRHRSDKRSCISAWRSHSSPQLLHAWAQACSCARVRLASLAGVPRQHPPGDLTDVGAVQVGEEDKEAWRCPKGGQRLLNEDRRAQGYPAGPGRRSPAG